MNDEDMRSELFVAPEENTEFWLPPKSKEVYLKDLESDISPDEKYLCFKALIEICRLETRGHGGRFSEAGADELLRMMQKQGEKEALSGKVAWLLMEEGSYCERIGDYQNALKFYESVLTYKVEDREFRYFRLNNTAFCLNYFKRFEEAEKHLREAVQIMPRMYNAWKNLGVSLEHQGKAGEAAGCYLQAVLFSNGERRAVLHLMRLAHRNPALQKGEWIEKH